MEVFPENNPCKNICPLFANFDEKIFDHFFKARNYSEINNFRQKLKKIWKIEKRLMKKSIIMHFLMKMLNQQANSFFLQWDFFFGTEEVIIKSTA